jgi:cellulose synthase/poly-beta-1,6-N-acetylglucosamine synthase-like glycosyltransferase
MPKVSVIIPNYNHARYLRQRIDSVLQQSFQDLEVILMDDCSKWTCQSRWSPLWPVLPTLGVPTRAGALPPRLFLSKHSRFLYGHLFYGFLDAPQRPSELPQCDDLLFL